jgi:hypothetical protein
MKTARFLGQLAFLKVAHPRDLPSTVRPCLFSSVMVDTKILEGASCLKWRGGSTQHGQYCKTSSFPRRRESSDSIQMFLEKSMGTDSLRICASLPDAFFFMPLNYFQFYLTNLS